MIGVEVGMRMWDDVRWVGFLVVFFPFFAFRCSVFLSFFLCSSPPLSLLAFVCVTERTETA